MEKLLCHLKHLINILKTCHAETLATLSYDCHWHITRLIASCKKVIKRIQDDNIYYLGKPGLMKTALNRFSISMHFGTSKCIKAHLQYNAFKNIDKVPERKRKCIEDHFEFIFNRSIAMRFQPFTMHFSEAVSQ